MNNFQQGIVCGAISIAVFTGLTAAFAKNVQPFTVGRPDVGAQTNCIGKQRSQYMHKGCSWLFYGRWSVRVGNTVVEAPQGLTLVAQ